MKKSRTLKPQQQERTVMNHTGITNTFECIMCTLELNIKHKGQAMTREDAKGSKSRSLEKKHTHTKPISFQHDQALRSCKQYALMAFAKLFNKKKQNKAKGSTAKRSKHQRKPPTVKQCVRVSIIDQVSSEEETLQVLSISRERQKKCANKQNKQKSKNNTLATYCSQENKQTKNHVQQKPT